MAAPIVVPFLLEFKAIDQFSSELKSMESGVIRFVGAVASLVAGMEAVLFPISQAKEFELSLKDIQRTSQLSNTEIEKLGNSLLEMGRTLGTSSKELAKIGVIAGQLGMGDQGRASMEEFIKQVAIGATAMDMTTEKAATLGAQIGNIYGIAGSEVNKIYSVLNTLAANSVATGASIADIVKRVGTTANATFPQIASLAAFMSQVGVPPEQAGTALVKFLSNMQAESKKFSKAFGIDQDEFVKMVSGNAYEALKNVMSRLSALPGGIREKLTKDLEGSGRLFSGANKLIDEAGRGFKILDQFYSQAQAAYASGTDHLENYAIRMDSLAKKMDVAFSSVESNFKSAGAKTLPMLKAIADSFNTFINSEKVREIFNSLGEVLVNVISHVKNLAISLVDIIGLMSPIMPLLSQMALLLSQIFTVRLLIIFGNALITLVLTPLKSIFSFFQLIGGALTLFGGTAIRNTATADTHAALTESVSSIPINANATNAINAEAEANNRLYRARSGVINAQERIDSLTRRGLIDTPAYSHAVDTLTRATNAQNAATINHTNAINANIAAQEAAMAGGGRITARLAAITTGIRQWGVGLGVVATTLSILLGDMLGSWSGIITNISIGLTVLFAHAEALVGLFVKLRVLIFENPYTAVIAGFLSIIAFAKVISSFFDSGIKNADTFSKVLTEVEKKIIDTGEASKKALQDKGLFGTFDNPTDPKFASSFIPDFSKVEKGKQTIKEFYTEQLDTSTQLKQSIESDINKYTTLIDLIHRLTEAQQVLNNNLINSPGNKSFGTTRALKDFDPSSNSEIARLKEIAPEIGDNIPEFRKYSTNALVVLIEKLRKEIQGLVPDTIGTTKTFEVLRKEIDKLSTSMNNVMAAKLANQLGREATSVEITPAIDEAKERAKTERALSLIQARINAIKNQEKGLQATELTKLGEETSTYIREGNISEITGKYGAYKPFVSYVELLKQERDIISKLQVGSAKALSPDSSDSTFKTYWENRKKEMESVQVEYSGLVQKYNDAKKNKGFFGSSIEVDILKDQINALRPKYEAAAITIAEYNKIIENGFNKPITIKPIIKSNIQITIEALSAVAISRLKHAETEANNILTEAKTSIANQSEGESAKSTLPTGVADYYQKTSEGLNQAEVAGKSGKEILAINEKVAAIKEKIAKYNTDIRDTEASIKKNSDSLGNNAKGSNDQLLANITANKELRDQAIKEQDNLLKQQTELYKNTQVIDLKSSEQVKSAIIEAELSGNRISALFTKIKEIVASTQTKLSNGNDSDKTSTALVASSQLAPIFEKLSADIQHRSALLAAISKNANVSEADRYQVEVLLSNQQNFNAALKQSLISQEEYIKGNSSIYAIDKNRYDALEKQRSKLQEQQVILNAIKTHAESVANNTEKQILSLSEGVEKVIANLSLDRSNASELAIRKGATDSIKKEYDNRKSIISKHYDELISKSDYATQVMLAAHKNQILEEMKLDEDKVTSQLKAKQLEEDINNNAQRSKDYMAEALKEANLGHTDKYQSFVSVAEDNLKNSQKAVQQLNTLSVYNPATGTVEFTRSVESISKILDKVIAQKKELTDTIPEGAKLLKESTGNTATVGQNELTLVEKQLQSLLPNKQIFDALFGSDKGKQFENVANLLDKSSDKWIAAVLAMVKAINPNITDAELENLRKSPALVTPLDTSKQSLSTPPLPTETDKKVEVNTAKTAEEISALARQQAAPKATGGYISGKGTSTSDEIPAMLSNGEYVINAATVSKYGTGFFDNLQNKSGKLLPSGLLGFAEGGSISTHSVNNEAIIINKIHTGLMDTVESVINATKQAKDNISKYSIDSFNSLQNKVSNLLPNVINPSLKDIVSPFNSIRDAASELYTSIKTRLILSLYNYNDGIIHTTKNLQKIPTSSNTRAIPIPNVDKDSLFPTKRSPNVIQLSGHNDTVTSVGTKLESLLHEGKQVIGKALSNPIENVVNPLFNRSRIPDDIVKKSSKDQAKQTQQELLRSFSNGLGFPVTIPPSINNTVTNTPNPIIQAPKQQEISNAPITITNNKGITFTEKPDIKLTTGENKDERITSASGGGFDWMKQLQNFNFKERLATPPTSSKSTLGDLYWGKPTAFSVNESYEKANKLVGDWKEPAKQFSSTVMTELNSVVQNLTSKGKPPSDKDKIQIAEAISDRNEHEKPVYKEPIKYGVDNFAFKPWDKEGKDKAQALVDTANARPDRPMTTFPGEWKPSPEVEGAWNRLQEKMKVVAAIKTSPDGLRAGGFADVVSTPKTMIDRGEMAGIDLANATDEQKKAAKEQSWASDAQGQAAEINQKAAEISLSASNKLMNLNFGGDTNRGFAVGGFVSGAGSNTSDSIPAWLSNGEYVIDAATTGFFGSQFFSGLQAMAGRGIPTASSNHFAEGGLVTPNEIVNVNFNAGGQSHSLYGERKQVQSLTNTLRRLDRQ